MTAKNTPNPDATENICAKCNHAYVFEDESGDLFGKDGAMNLQCRANPPSVGANGRAVWPIVDEVEFCSNFMPDGLTQ